MSRQWETGLCNYIPCGLCLKGTFCTGILVGQNHERITRNIREPKTTSGWCCGWFGLQCCLGSGFVLQMLDRIEMNEKYGLEGSPFGACCRAFWCGCCEAIQTKKELDYIQIEGNAQGYVQGEEMVAQPQRASKY